MGFFLIASGVGLLIGLGLAYLVVKLREAFTRDEQPESDPMLLHEPPPGGDKDR
jgi:hypothetical protein